MSDLDSAARRVAHGRSALDLEIGETLVRFFERGGPARFSYSRQIDYAAERLGISGSLMNQCKRLARRLQDRPILKRAVQCGAVTKNKALAIAGVAHGEDESRWTAAAMHLSLAELKERLKEDGHDPRADTFEVESIVLQMAVQEQDRLDAGLEMAGTVVGADAPRWMRLEVMSQEWLGSCCQEEPVGREIQPNRIPFPKLDRCLDDPIPVDHEPSNDLKALDRHLRKLVKQRTEREVELGRLLVKIDQREAYKEVGFDWLGLYCTERLGISLTKMRGRMRLEEKFIEFPQLREAVASGRLSLHKAWAVARLASVFDIDTRIEAAAATTQQQVDQDTTAEEDQQNRALGIRRIWGPVDAAETILHAIYACKWQSSKRGWPISDGAALAQIADHFVWTWTLHRVGDKASRKRKTVLGRCKGLCAVPGCSKAAEQLHHIVYRSRGGGDETWNLVGLCAFHHLRGVHGGFILVEGDAEVELTWIFHVPDEAWKTTPEGRATRVAMPA